MGKRVGGADADQKADAAVPDFDKAVLYAPTFRDHGETRLFPFPEFDGGNGRERLDAFLKEHRMFLCIRMHLYDRTAYGWLAEMDHPGSRVRFLNEDRAEDVMEALGCFDLLITDYSSIYLDFLLTGRPMIFLPYDRGEYLADRGMNFDYDQVTPGPKPENFAEFLRWLGALDGGRGSLGRRAGPGAAVFSMRWKDPAAGRSAAWWKKRLPKSAEGKVCRFCKIYVKKN